MIPVLYDIVKHGLQSLHIPVIWTYQNATRIPKPYVTLNYRTVIPVGHDDYDGIDEDGIRNIYSLRRVTAELQFFCGRESFKYASRALMLLGTDASSQKQCELGISIGNNLMLEHVPVLLNESQFEDRAIYQFEFYYYDTIPEDVGIIEEVELEGCYDCSRDEELDPNKVFCKETISVKPRQEAENGQH